MDVDSLKLPPHSLEAEQAVLGGLLLDNGAWVQMADLIASSDFYRRDHQLIFDNIAGLLDDNQPCDVITLSEWLQNQQQLEAVGGLAYLGELAKNTPSAANIKTYAKIVRERSILRQLIQVGTDIANSGFDPQGRKTDELLDTAEQQVFAIAEQTSRGGGFVPIKHLLAEAVDKIDTLFHKEGAITGVATGFNDFDEQTSGLQPGDMVIVAGRPSMGKCLSKDSEILLSDGRIETIETLYRQQKAQLLSLNNDWQFHPAPVAAFVDDGQKPVFRLRTRLGRQISTTETHPYMTIQGWQPLSQLKVGDKIAVPRRLSIFGTQAQSEQQIKTWAQTTTTIPSEVFSLPRQQLALFLRQLFKTESLKTTVEYPTASATLARQTQHLLLRFGIMAKHEQQLLVIDEVQSLQLFANEILLEDINTATVAEDNFPLEIWQEIEQLKGDEPWQALLQRAKLASIQAHQDSLSRTQLSKFAHALNNQRLKDLADSAVYWDEVVSIEPLGLQQVYDLIVPETHNFVANDICVHNTTYAMNIAENVAVYEKLPVAVFSMEMPGEQLAMRLMSSLGRIDQHKVRTGQLENDDWPRLTSAISMMSEAPMFIDDTPALSPTELRARTRRLAQEHGQLGLIVIDYLQLMQVPGQGENRATEVGIISRSLKSLAKELKVPVMALSQLNRSLEQRPDKRPKMSDLRESGSIEQDADLIAFIYRDEVYNEDSEAKGTAEIIIAKQRNGPIGTVRLAFIGRYTRFENFSPDVYDYEE